MQFANPWTRRRVIVYGLLVLPAALQLLAAQFYVIDPLRPGFPQVAGFTPFELGISVFLFLCAVVALGTALVRQYSRWARQLEVADERGRAITALGVGASWDLDLHRIYTRFAADLKALVPYDRLTITTARSDGQMVVAFVFGKAREEAGAGLLITPDAREPDGLGPKTAAQYLSKMSVPIQANNGVLTLRSEQADAYNQEDVELLRLIVGQVSPGIANARLFEQSQRQLQERTALAEIGRASTEEHEVGAIFRIIETSLRNLVAFDHIGVVLAGKTDDDPATIEYWSQPGLLGLDLGDTVKIDEDAFAETSLVSGDHATLLNVPLPDDPEVARTWVQVAMTAREHLTGLLILSFTGSRDLSEDESHLVQRVSTQVAPAIESARLTESLRKLAEERRAIAAIGLAANYELSVDAIFDRVADELRPALSYDRLEITYNVPNSTNLEIAFARGVEVAGRAVGDEVPGIDSREIRLVKGKKRFYRSGEDSDPPLPDAERKAGLESWIQVPLGAGLRRIGYLSLRSKRQFAYDPDDLELLDRVADQIAPAIQNARMFAQERELREQLDQQNQDLIEAQAARKVFLSTVSHELKTPLAIISGFVDLLEDNTTGNLDDEQVETLAIIRRNASRLALLINDMLDITRLDAGTFRIEPVEFDAADLMKEVAASFQGIVDEKAQALGSSIPEQPTWIKADRNRVAQVVSNLISNASKYSPEGSEIRLSCAVKKDSLEIAVTDQGIGISPKDQQKLFTPFFRVDNEETRKVSGTGLGLVITKSIVEQHGGDIELDSEPGKGTTVRFTLPGLLDGPSESGGEPEEFDPTVARSRLYPDVDMDDLALGA